MKARELEAELNEVLGAYGRPEEKRGLIFGDAEREVTRAGFCWSATEGVLEEAARRGCEAVVAHEILYVPRGRGELGLPEDHPELPANRKRRELMEKHPWYRGVYTQNTLNDIRVIIHILWDREIFVPHRDGSITIG